MLKMHRNNRLKENVRFRSFNR